MLVITRGDHQMDTLNFLPSSRRRCQGGSLAKMERSTQEQQLGAEAMFAMKEAILADANLVAS